jgi:peptidoglycan hydrolase-like protein with peptidoglycan-binding domain
MNRATRNALHDFQKREGLPVDGIAGPETKTALQEARSGGTQPAATEFEWEQDPSMAYSPRRVMEQEVGFSSPRRAPRQVRANFVSCNPPSAAIESITGSDPVGTIRRANARAIELLDNVINKLQITRNRVRRGAAADFPTVSGAMSDALQGRFRLDANLRNTWTGTGSRSVLVLIRRLRGARQILADGWMRYTCLGAGTVTLGKCRRVRGNGCPPDRPNRRAVSCGGHSRIVLCRAWWSDTLDDQAGTLLHECFHIYFGFIADSGNFGNAHCYEHLVLELNGLSPQAEFEAACP